MLTKNPILLYPLKEKNVPLLLSETVNWKVYPNYSIRDFFQVRNGLKSFSLNEESNHDCITLLKFSFSEELPQITVRFI